MPTAQELPINFDSRQAGFTNRLHNMAPVENWVTSYFIGSGVHIPGQTTNRKNSGREHASFAII